MKLSPEDQAEYDTLSAEIRARKEACVEANDTAGARKCRQESTRLHDRFAKRSLPEELPPPEPTLEERVEALEAQVANLERVIATVRELAGV